MSDIVLLDGGMGQELVRRSAQPAHPQWSAWVMLHEPEIVQAVHEDYLRAGAQAGEGCGERSPCVGSRRAGRAGRVAADEVEDGSGAVCPLGALRGG